MMTKRRKKNEKNDTPCRFSESVTGSRRRILEEQEKRIERMDLGMGVGEGPIRTGDNVGRSGCLHLWRFQSTPY